MAPMPELLKPGTILGGRYQIVRLAGSGGGSHVYAASDLKLPGKIWAVKQTKSDPGGTSRMEDEAGMLIALDHPRFPRIVDYFQGGGEDTTLLNELEDCFLVMDYLEGSTLEEHVRRKTVLSQAELIRLAEQICEGLHYLHTLKPPIIYRDLKPSNLIVEHKGEIRFIDFGTARTYKPQLSEDTVQLGTIGFAAPEQYLGKQSDPRTDLYALGAILLYLASNGRYTQWPKEKGGFERTEFPRDCTPDFSKMVHKLLSYEQADRFQSALEVREVLNRLKRNNHTPLSANHGTERPVVIAVTGAAPGIGTTHLTLLIARSLAGYYPNITYVEWNEKTSTVSGLQNLQKDPSLVSDRRLEYGQLTLYKKPSRSEWLKLLGSGHGLIVLDMGVEMKRESLEEFTRADLQIVVVPAARWRRDEVNSCIRMLSPYRGRKRVYAAAFADAYDLEQLGRQLDKEKVFAIPLEPDPFQPDVRAVEAAQDICRPLLPGKKHTAKGLSGWFRKINHRE